MDTNPFANNSLPPMQQGQANNSFPPGQGTTGLPTSGGGMGQNQLPPWLQQQNNPSVAGGVNNMLRALMAGYQGNPARSPGLPLNINPQANNSFPPSLGSPGGTGGVTSPGLPPAPMSLPTASAVSPVAADPTQMTPPVSPSGSFPPSGMGASPGGSFPPGGNPQLANNSFGPGLMSPGNSSFPPTGGVNQPNVMLPPMNNPTAGAVNGLFGAQPPLA